MTTAVKAIYEHGVFRPVTPVRLKEAPGQAPRPWTTTRSSTAGDLRRHEFLRRTAAAEGRQHDKVYSAVDCLSFMVMLEHGITEAFSFDEDFSHRFVERPGPSRK